MTAVKTSDQIRSEFFSFFEEKGHTLVDSAPLVPHDDPSLLFTNAGMNQFKDVFLGTGSRPYNRAVDTQKCLRVSGKHNDLEEVGHDTYHHTFFEMLGNWSFGDYFKREAVRWAWELLTDVWQIDGDRLYVTVHEGDEALGLEPDEEAAEHWRNETSIKPEHILYESSRDNFWMMGDTGPCGPCSEVHVDLRSKEDREATPGVELVNADHPQVMEIWNLVFIQFNALGGGGLEPLEDQHVDTGMGFERMVAVLQGASSTYDTDLFSPLLEKAAGLSPRAEVTGYNAINVADATEQERIRVALRVVADHIRTIAFAVADGVSPGNTGRGYVIRRILRRAVRYGYQTLNFQEPFLYRLLPVLQEKMSGVFPELNRQKDYLKKVIRAEEEGFLETLGTGVAFFETITPHLKSLSASEETGDDLGEALSGIKSDGRLLDLLENAYVDTDDRERMLDRFSRSAADGNLPGEIAFLLHDTYGFPIDLTRLMAREEGFGVDEAGYDALMQQQRTRAREAAVFTGPSADKDAWERISTGEHSDFLGYDTCTVENASIRGIRDEGGRWGVTLDRTPFYAESGGQVGDTGILVVGDEVLHVADTQKEQDRIVHFVDSRPDNPDAPVRAAVDRERRQRIRKNHTATHLLHAALRETIGTHVAQKGSLVAPDRLRFDFSHYEAVTPDQLRAVEQRVNAAIRDNIPRGEEREADYDDAIARGAMALFGEKYGKRVRVITFNPDFSIELCGGTHADATGELGLFHLVSEGSVAAGIRRVEALAGENALRYVHAALDQLSKVRRTLGTTQDDAEEEIAALIAQNKALQKQNEQLRQEQLAAHLDDFIEQGIDIGAVRLVTGRLSGVEMDALRTLGQTLRDRLGAGAVGVLGATDPAGEKVYLVASVADDVIGSHGIRAGELVGSLAKRVGGGGGGRPQFATAGGREPENLGTAIEAVKEELQQLL